MSNNNRPSDTPQAKGIANFEGFLQTFLLRSRDSQLQRSHKPSTHGIAESVQISPPHKLYCPAVAKGRRKIVCPTSRRCVPSGVGKEVASKIANWRGSHHYFLAKHLPPTLLPSTNAEGSATPKLSQGIHTAFQKVCKFLLPTSFTSQHWRKGEKKSSVPHLDVSTVGRWERSYIQSCKLARLPPLLLG